MQDQPNGVGTAVATTTVNPADDEITVVLSHAAYDVLFRAALASARKSMEIAEAEMHSMQEQRDLHEGSSTEDVRSHLRILREDLDVLDALPWPEWSRPIGKNDEGES